MIGQKIQKLGSREKQLLSVAGVIVLALLADGLVARPLVKRLRGMDREIAQIAKRIAVDSSIAGQRSAVAGEFARVEKIVEVSADAGGAQDRMSAQISDSAGRTGLTMDELVPREPRRGDHYDLYAFEITRFECQITQLVQFLHELGAQPGMLRVSRINFDNAPAGNKVRGSMVITKAVVRPS